MGQTDLLETPHGRCRWVVESAEGRAELIPQPLSLSDEVVSVE